MKQVFIMFLAIPLFTNIIFSRIGNFKHGFGWDDGLSYKRYFSEKFWAGFNISGRVNFRSEDDLSTRRTYFPTNDSSTEDLSNRIGWADAYATTLTIIGNSNFYQSSNFGISAFYGLGYGFDYQKGKEDDVNNRTQFSENYLHNAILMLGISPNYLIKSRFMFESRFGLKASYNYRNANSDINDVYTSPSSYSPGFTRTYASERKNFSLGINLIGRSFSLTSGFIVHYLF